MFPSPNRPRCPPPRLVLSWRNSAAATVVLVVVVAVVAVGDAVGEALTAEVVAGEAGVVVDVEAEVVVVDSSSPTCRNSRG